jgi:hypothetical protein
MLFDFQNHSGKEIVVSSVLRQGLDKGASHGYCQAVFASAFGKGTTMPGGDSSAIATDRRLPIQATGKVGDLTGKLGIMFG